MLSIDDEKYIFQCNSHFRPDFDPNFDALPLVILSDLKFTRRLKSTGITFLANASQWPF